MPFCSLKCSFYNNLMYGYPLNIFVTENKCKKCHNFIVEGCYEICHKCCDILSLEFLYQHEHCIEPSKFELNYENVLEEIKKLNMSSYLNFSHKYNLRT